jgi:ferrochelatase
MTRRGHNGRALDAGLPTGLLLSGMGGPDGPDAVAPFLRNLFADPAILPLPAPFARLLGAFIAWRRSETVKQRYISMGLGGASPQLGWVRRQGEALEKLLSESGFTIFAEPAMRYWRPFPEEAVAKLLDRGARQFIVLPTFPQYSAATTGSIARAISAAHAKLASRMPLLELGDWHLLPGYLEALIEKPAQHLTAWADAGVAPDRCALIYAAHSLPERFVRAGDPYLDQTVASVAAAHDLLRDGFGDAGWLDRVSGGAEPKLGFQSRVGPIRWIGPNINDQLRELAAGGTTHLFVQPVSFSCEHIETKYELDREFGALAASLGVDVYERGPALNLNAGWLAGLAALVAAQFDASAPSVTARGEVGHV